MRKLRWHTPTQIEHLGPFRAGVSPSHHQCLSPGHTLGGLGLGVHMHNTDIQWGQGLGARPWVRDAEISVSSVPKGLGFQWERCHN